jgi:hypothetical protein
VVVQYWLSAEQGWPLHQLLTDNARMAKSADAADLKSAGRKAVGVQVPLWAPSRIIHLKAKSA